MGLIACPTRNQIGNYPATRQSGGAGDGGERTDRRVDRTGGGYANHPADKGGPTRFGITEAVARAHGYAGPMAALPREEAVTIYKRLYWLRPRFDEVAERCPRLAGELFDTGANMGPAVAATFVQRVLTALNRGGRDYGNYILDAAEAIFCKPMPPKLAKQGACEWATEWNVCLG